MSINHENRDPYEGKASSLSSDTLPKLARLSGAQGKKNKESVTAKSKKRGLFWRGFAVDMVLILLIVGVGVGVWMGYRAVKNAYEPAWETRWVEYSVEIRNIDYDRADQLLPALSDHGLWRGNQADGDYLGEVRDVRALPSVTEDGRETMTLYLTVAAETKYLRGEGYFMGDTRLLAGISGIFRAEGLLAEGTIVSLREMAEVTT